MIIKQALVNKHCQESREANSGRTNTGTLLRDNYLRVFSCTVQREMPKNCSDTQALQLNNSLHAFDSLWAGTSEFSGLLLAISVLIKLCVNGALRQNSLRVVSNKCVC